MRTVTETKTIKAPKASARKNGGSDAATLKTLMAEVGYTTNAQLAQDMGVSDTTVANWLAGKTEPAQVVLKYLALKRDLRRIAA